MPSYNFRYLTAGGAFLRMEVLACPNDKEAIAKAQASMPDPDGLVEVWRAELIYHGTGKGSAA